MKQQPEGELVKIWVNSKQNGLFQIGVQILESLKTKLTELSKHNIDMFAWVQVDMPGIDLDFMSHRLAIDPSVKVVA